MSVIDKHIESCLAPRASLLCKVASLIVHFDEFHGPDGAGVDLFEIIKLMKDPEILAWISDMTDHGLAPVKRICKTPKKRKKK